MEKSKKGLKYIVILLLLVIAIFGFSTELFSNLWGVVTDSAYVIPKESSIFTFKVTKSNSGSGDYWLYGKDKNYFYSQMKSESDVSYIKISVKEAKDKSEFDETNYKSWSYEYLCGDLLEIYAKKHDKMKFINSEVVDEIQTVVIAIYRVNGKDVREVEDFLVENYGMGRLKRICCAWDTAGKYGNFNHDELRKIDEALMGYFVMYLTEDGVSTGDIHDVKEIEEVDYFTVEVRLAII